MPRTSRQKNETPPDAEIVQRSEEKLEVPTAFEVAKLYALIDEVDELTYRKIRPFSFILTAVSSDRFILNIHTIPLIGHLREAIYTALFPLLLDPESRQIVEKVFSKNYSNQDVIAFNRISSEQFPEIQAYLDKYFVLFIQGPMIPALYFISKSIFKKISNKLSRPNISLQDKSHSNTNTSKTKINTSIGQLTQTSENLRTASNKIANYSFLLSLALLAMTALASTKDENIYFINLWLFVFSCFAKAESYLTKRSLAKTASDLEKITLQLNSITESVRLQWSLNKGSYLKSSPCILNISHHNDVENQSGKLGKKIFLKILRTILLNYGFKILCFNSYRGIIVAREETLNDRELQNIKSNLKDSLTHEIRQEKNISSILDYLKNISQCFLSNFHMWNHYPEGNYFALNILQLNEDEVSLMKDKLTQHVGSAHIEFPGQSGYLKVSGTTHANILREALKAIRAEKSENRSNTNTQTQESTVSEQPSNEKVKSRPKYVTTTLFSGQPASEVKPSENASERYPIYSPNFPVNTHFSRYSVENTGIMTTKTKGKKTLYERFFDVVEDGQMGGRGNHIARLRNPKTVTGSNITIFATHKLVIPEEDVRIYGEMKKVDNVHEVDFKAVVPTHQWANR